MQNSDKSMVKAKAMKVIAAQVMAIAEELKADELIAPRIVEDALAAAAAICDWDLSASGEAQGTGCKRQDSGKCGHKCGEGACKAKEEIHTPAPVSKPAAPGAAPEATDEIWDTDLDKIWVGSIKIGSQNRVTIPRRVIEQAERINGTLKSKRHKFGALTVIKGNYNVTVLFGDKSAEHEGSRVVHLNCNGQAQFRVSPVFFDGEAVECFLFKDGAIAFTMIGE